MCMGSDAGALRGYCQELWQYRSVYSMLVRNELKGKFKNTVLGYFWHLLNPLSQIVIYYLIFTVIFGRDIPNYWVYLSSGMFAFNFFLQCVSTGSNCIVSNTRLVTKIAMPREIIVFAKVTTNFINLLISYGLLLFLMVVLNIPLSLYLLTLCIIMVFLALFCCGLTLFF